MFKNEKNATHVVRFLNLNELCLSVLIRIGIGVIFPSQLIDCYGVKHATQ